MCVVSTPERAPAWGVLADALSRRLPDQREVLHLSFSLADSDRLERLLTAAGFRDVDVTPETRLRSFASFEEYWTPIEAGTGQLPQAYLALPESSRRAVKDEVRARLGEFDVDGRIRMTLETLIGRGRA